jgi:hypothetical protein
MAKRKIYHLHKIKVHHNRWLLWAIAYILFVAIAMIGYLKVANINIDTENAENRYNPSHSYNNSRLGFALTYPPTWSIEANSDTSVTFMPSDTSDDGVTISVSSTAAEKDIRKSLKITQETPVMVGNLPGVKITADLGKNLSEKVVLIPSFNKLYVIRGSGSQVEKVLTTFKVLPTK